MQAQRSPATRPTLRNSHCERGRRTSLGADLFHGVGRRATTAVGTRADRRKDSRGSRSDACGLCLLHPSEATHEVFPRGGRRKGGNGWRRRRRPRSVRDSFQQHRPPREEFVLRGTCEFWRLAHDHGRLGLEDELVEGVVGTKLVHSTLGVTDVGSFDDLANPPVGDKQRNGSGARRLPVRPDQTLPLESHQQSLIVDGKPAGER
mmetsp:Transcript_7393/g.23632  ORF Transcript_7393/g.23632 Transcript_7393/m.23632 type:complete len:205 (-) Transcript_7393:772-1386(-)